MGILYDMPIQLCQNASRGDAVAGGSVLRYTQSDIFHVGQDASLAGGIEGKFSAVGSAGGCHENNRMDIRRNGIFFSHGDGPFQVHIDLISAFLHTGVID